MLLVTTSQMILNYSYWDHCVIWADDGWTFDNIKESTCISRESHRQFFNVFIHYGSIVLYDRHVTLPAMSSDISIFEELFLIAGYNGCI